MLKGELRSRTRFGPAETLVLAGTAGAGGIAPPASTRISARTKRVQGHSSLPNTMWRTHVPPSPLPPEAEPTAVLRDMTQRQSDCNRAPHRRLSNDAQRQVLD